MGRKLKGRKLTQILEEHYHILKTKPEPTETEMEVAVELHNEKYTKSYSEPWGRRNGQAGFRMHDYDQRRLPVVYQPKEEPKKNDTWTCTVMDTKGCPIVGKPEVRMPIEMYQAWTEMAEEFDTEWMGYLIGTFDNMAGKGEITEVYFPPQSASGAHVEMPDENFRVRPGTIGAVHSHVKMQAFFSSTDEAHANWPIEIVINARGESLMRARVKLECGRFSRVDGTIMLVGTLPRYSDKYRDALKAAMKSSAESATEAMNYGIYGGY